MVNAGDCSAMLLSQDRRFESGSALYLTSFFLPGREHEVLPERADYDALHLRTPDL